MAETPADDERAQLEDRPPFLSWRAIYLVVLSALAAEVVLFAVISRVFR
jgi:hypothetical protein